MHSARFGNKDAPRPRSLARSVATGARSVGSYAATSAVTAGTTRGPRTSELACDAPGHGATNVLRPRTGPWSWGSSASSGVPSRLPAVSPSRTDFASATRRSTATSGATKRRGGAHYTHLRQAGKKRRKRYGAYDSRGRLAGKRPISERPPVVDARTEVGHWEIDTVLGVGRPCIVTLVERSTGFLMIGKLKARTVAELNRAVLNLLGSAPLPVYTITADNGTEFHGYKALEAATGVRFYFATPPHSWERGTSENTNGLIRQYLPKRRSMARLTRSACDRIADRLNDRPRKRLDYLTPREAYERLCA